MILAFELVVVILTVRSISGALRSGTPLLKVIYRDSVAFFSVLFAVTLSAILVQELGPPQFNELMSVPFRVVHSIVCCRILLNLRRAVSLGGPPEGSSTSLAFATAHGEQTNSVEVVRLETETSSTWSEERDSHQ